MTESLVTIVLVDDAPEVRALTRTRLKLSRRFDVIGEGSTGLDALQLVQELAPQLILLDVSMPDMDGLEALERIRAQAPDTMVAMFSGFEEHGLADQARALGAIDFIEKSVPIEQLSDRLLAAMAGAEPPTVLRTPADPEPVLREHLERFRAAFDQAAIGMATLTLTGRVVRANEALEEIPGVPPEGLVGIPYEKLVSEADRDTFVDTVTEISAGRRDVASLEHGLGERRVVATIAVVRDSQRAPLYLFLQVQDVTEQRAAEEELRRSEEQFRLLVEGVGDYAIFMLDAKGYIISWNLGAERAKGYVAEEVLGRHFSIFYPPAEIARRHPQYELRVAEAEGRYEEEGWRVRKDGSMFWANVVLTALRDRKTGRLLGFAKVTRDVTERRRLLENLEAAAAERTQLLAVTAHELRTPVSVVTGFVSTLQDHWEELDDAERRDIIASLARGGERLSRLVDDLFTSARLESGGLELERSAFDLIRLLHEIAGDVGGDAIRVEGDSVTVFGDCGRTQQMVSNYLTNALRHGRPPVRIKAAADAGMAVVTVSDEGPGVRENLLPRLFARYSGSGKADSTGLGLFIVRELARAQGGDAWYEPSPAGSTFMFTLPLAVASGA
ncbi:MAG TPA: PAS domain S-box protein [Acidimicrobiales bacterium]|nr:PAS domain S-box protein [Acidimicrobiales bacterium]